MISIKSHERSASRSVYGVIGDPIGHSLSPLLHNTGFEARGMNSIYIPYRVTDLKAFIATLGVLGIRGFSVTIPHKEAMLDYLDECDPLAASIGAVNTVTVQANGKLCGCNTDYLGVLRALERRMQLRGSRVLIFGAGGAARAVAFALAEAGAAVTVCARRPGQAVELARHVEGEWIDSRLLKFQSFDAVVNTTPVGMYPHVDQSPLRSEDLNCRVVFDSIYRPLKTRLLELAEKKGIETVAGVDMFLAQGIAQWEIWTGEKAPEEEMRAAVLAKLRQDEDAEKGAR